MQIPLRSYRAPRLNAEMKQAIFDTIPEFFTITRLDILKKLTDAGYIFTENQIYKYVDTLHQHGLVQKFKTLSDGRTVLYRKSKEGTKTDNGVRDLDKTKIKNLRMHMFHFEGLRGRCRSDARKYTEDREEVSCYWCIEKMWLVPDWRGIDRPKVEAMT